MKKSITLLLVAAALAAPATTTAAYNPAPAHIVKAAQQKAPPPRGTTKKRAWIICRVFPRGKCVAALNVSWCESTLRPWARNGQYLGVFQMGARERATYGHGPSVWMQAEAAKKYNARSGWQPWSCRP